MKKFIALILVVMMCMTIMPAVVSANTNTRNLVIDGIAITPAASQVTSDGVLMTSTEFLTDAFGADVEFSANRRSVTITTSASTVRFTIGSTNCSINSRNRAAPAAPRMSGNHFLIPISYYASIIGGSSATNTRTNTIAISYFTNLRGELKISGSTTLNPIVVAAADRLMEANSGLSITVAGGGSGAGINDAAAGTVHIGMSSRDLRDDELRNLNAYAIGNEGIAVILHPSNRINNLTSEQVKQIFAGEITNWRDVGGANAPILVYTRETGSGTRSTFQDLIMGGSSGTPIVARATPFNSSALIMQGVARERNSIGYVSIGYVDNTIKAISVDDTFPTVDTVLDGTYVMGRQLWMCTRGRATGLAARFIDYLRSEAVQNEVVVETGFFKIR
jgi:phosphate transport system substrate-binding protein